MRISQRVRVWLSGLVAALVSGAATGITTSIVLPETSAEDLGKVMIMGALIGVAGYLKQSPMPPHPGDVKPPT